MVLAQPCVDCTELKPVTDDFMPSPAPVPPIPAPDRLSKEAEGLVDGGNDYIGANVQKSESDDILMAAAEACAKDQARRCLQGHHNWDRRFRELSAKLPGYLVTEIVAESWDRQFNETSMTVLGRTMFESWHWSSGHWNVAKRKHDYWGGSMAKGRNGIWYSCILTADRRN